MDIQEIIKALSELPNVVSNLKQLSEKLSATAGVGTGSPLMNETEAEEYLRRDADTLRYYRTLGLPSFKKGKDRWYLKSDIDAWLASGRINRHQR